MYSVGSLIVYGSTGVCRVDAVGPSPVGSSGDRTYYTLTPLRGSGTIYVPVDTGVFIRPILTRQEALALIDRIPQIRQAQLESRDYRALSQEYRTFLDSHRCEDLVQLIKAVYLKTHHTASAGKKPSKVDQDYQKRAETLLHDELAAALDIPFDQVKDFIAQRIRQLEGNQA